LVVRFAAILFAPALAWSAAAGSDDVDPALPAPEDAPIALMVDLSSGQTLFARDPDRRFVPASITKVMTAFLAFELIEEKKLFPHQIITVSDRMFEEWDRKGSTMFLKLNQRVTVDELLHGITTVSANDGSAVLAEGAAGSVERWTQMMNEKAREIGMRDSHFGTPNGWPDEGRTYVSARDLATLTQAMFVRHPQKYARYFGHHRFKFNEIEQLNHDPVTGVVPGADGIKTGFTNQAGYGFLGTAQRNGRRLVMVVAASPTGRTRNKASREFLEWGFSLFESRRVFPYGTQIGTAEVQEGADRSVGLVAPVPIRVAVPRGSSPAVSMEIHYEGPLRAPIEKGESVAELEITIGDLPPSRVPLLAANAVPEAGALQRLRNGLLGLF
jgi:serine-type D-Ala-D-Ala carboxypeptidase (penicillin-binding protein 5/6)